MPKHKLKTFLERIRFKYKISILNENTLEETWFIRLSRLRVFLWSGFFLILTFLLMTLLILKTPLKKFLPMNDHSGVRTEYMETAIKIDSLNTVMKQQADYLDLLKSIVAGEIRIDSVIPLDSIALAEREKLLVQKSKREKEFVQDFEQEKLYQLNMSASYQSSDVTVFFKPAKGIITTEFSANDGHFGIDILTSPAETVYSVLQGAVIFTTFTLEDEFVIGIQHANDYVSIYKHNSQLLKKPGDNVRAGEPIGVVGSNDKIGTHLHFELWQKGFPLNPKNHIAF